MFRIRMLPAAYGDCLWLEYGKSKNSLRRVLIDGGTPGSYVPLKGAIEELPEAKRQFELFIVTHVDSDHIGGSLKLLENREKLGVQFGDLWFNGYKHLTPDKLGGKQGDRLTGEILSQKLKWNDAFGTKSVVVPDSGALPVKTLAGGLRLTLLSPTWKELKELRPKWEEEVRKAGLKPGVPPEKPKPKHKDVLGTLNVDKLAAKPFKPETTKANASSIVLLAEYEGSRILLAADGQVQVLLKTLPRLSAAQRKGIRWFKMPHHGSRANLNKELLDLLECRDFLVSTNGKIYNHPDREAIARVIKHAGSPRFHFNYRTEFNDDWDSKILMKKHGYEVQYPKGSDGMTIDL